MPRSLALLFLVACGQGSESDTADTAPVTIATGAELYDEFCSSCHGPEGLGTSFGPNLSSEVPGASDADLIDLIRSGRGAMPPIPVDEDKAQRIVDHLRELFPSG